MFRPFRARLVALLLASLPFMGLAGPVLAADSHEATVEEAEASKPVERLSDALIEAMKAGEAMSFDERFEALAPVVRETFDIPLMTRLSLGAAAWDKLDEAKRQALVDAFARMSVSAYASRFSRYDNQHFSVKEVQKGPQGALLVTSMFSINQSDSVQFSYVMRKTKGDWRVVDVLVNGQYSELARRRAEFAAVLRDEGVDGLLGRISEISEKYRAESNAG
jgi:phospholipid transport system substrate-binding protein